MIVTVTLNPALDLTYTVDALVPHATNRVRTVAERPGGKGLNVASVLHALGEPVLATGLLGGHTGERVRDLVGFPAAFVPIAGETRRTVTIVDGADATGLWEPGPMVTGPEWAAFQDHFRDLLATAHVVVLSGSLPEGLPPDAYAVLIRRARDHKVPSVLDSSGDPLHHGLAAEPDVVKPNEHELAGHDPQAIVAAGTRAVVVSRGERGLHAHTADGSWHVPPPAVVRGNPTGAGDACVAALARGLRDRSPWPAVLADAAALSAAAVAAPVAGVVDLSLYQTFRSETQGARPDVQPHG